MRTNMLHVTEVPSAIFTCELNLTYPEVIQLFKTKPVYFHLHKNILFFIGDPELVKATLKTASVTTTINKVEIDKTSIGDNWMVLRVLFYKIIRFFLYRNGFHFHTKFKNRAFMIKEKRYGARTLIYDYSEMNRPAFVHEGFTFFLRIYNGEIFFGINPCVVLTRDGTNCISPKDLSLEKYMEYKNYFVDRRYNSKIREMFLVFAEIFCGEAGKIVIPTFNGQFEIDGNAVEVD